MLRTLMMCGGLLMLAIPLAAQTQLPTKRVLTLEAARRVVAAAEAEARKNNWAVSIAVLDDSGHMILFQRMDGAKLVATDIAIRKARTAVYFQGPTKDLEAEVAGGRTALLPIEGFMPLEGGVPLMSGGQLVGAVGVSGVSGAQDAQCALAGAATIK
ncbi:MAG TPA: heme-binding protein [Vicinamibacterales bacterium]|nr:heme-binding protein [Vicinamibacterales bacterium]